MLREELQAAMEEQNLSILALTNELSLGQSTLTRLMRKQREIDPAKVLIVVRRLLPESELRLMTEYFTELQRPCHLAIAIEYASTHRLFPQMEALINKALETKNAELVETAGIYKNLMDFQQEKIDEVELYNLVRFEKSRYEESSILLRIMEMYSLYFQKEYKFMKISMGDIESKISIMTNDYMRESFAARISEILHFTSLNIDRNIQEARKHAQIVLNSNNVGDSYHSSALFSLGMSHLFESGEVAISYFNEAKSLYDRNDRLEVSNVVAATIEYTKVYNNMPIDYFIDRENKAFHMILNNKKEQGMEILNEIEFNSSDENPYRHYYMGVASGDPMYYWKALKGFASKGDRYLAERVVKPSLLALSSDTEFIIDSIIGQ